MAELQAELAKLRAATDAELARQRAAFEKDLQSAGRKSVSLREEQKQLARMQEALEEAERQKALLADEVARITEEKELLENQYDDALNSTLISFKSPAKRIPNSGRKSIGRLSLSGYADEFASLGVSNAEVEALNKRTAELERIVERQAEEIERLIKKGSADDSYDMEGLDQKYTQLQEQLDAERYETTKYREEASRLSGLVETINSERGVLSNRVRKYQEDELAYEATIAELESLQAESLAMRSEIETYKKRIFNADQTVDHMGRQLETEKTQIFSLEDRLKVAERDLEAARYDNNALEQVLTRKNTVLNTELNNARSEIRKLRDENGEGKTLNHRLKQENIDLSTNLQRWQARANEFETKHHESEAESKRARSELESIKRETAVALRNAELREQEMASTLVDNQSELGSISTEMRNVKSERDHLVNQVRNLTDQVHEMKHSNAELLNETNKKHEADLTAVRQKANELEALLQSARREKAHYESQFKAVQKQAALDAQASAARVKDVEQALEAQRKLNARLQRDTSGAAAVAAAADQVDTSALVGGRQVTVLGSPAVDLASATGRRELQAHASQPVVQARAVVAPSPSRQLQRHPTAPIEQAQPAEVVAPAEPAVRQLTAQPSAPSVQPAAAAATVEASAANPLAFWRAKINGQQKPAAVNPVASTTPVVARRPPIAPVSVARAATTPAQPIVSPFLKRVPSQVGEASAPSAILADIQEPPAKRLSMVQEIRQELEKDDEEALSPIMVAKPVAPTREEDELMMDLGQTADKENSSGATDSSSTDGYMRIWKTALSTRPGPWQAALSRVPGAADTFQFGSKKIQCRLIGSDMLVIDGKSQVLVDRFLDQHGQELVSGPAKAAEPPVTQPAAPAPVQEATAAPAAPTEIKKGGLRFKNLRKQPLGQSNDMESQ